jgi:hypothetical protein
MIIPMQTNAIINIQGVSFSKEELLWGENVPIFMSLGLF